MTETGTHLFFIYEQGHLPVLEARLEAGEKLKVVALDYEVELEMKKRDIKFVSLTDLSVSPDGDRDLLEYMRALALQWYTAPEMEFFTYDGIALGEQHEVLVLYYLETLVYYLAVLEQVFSHFSDTVQISIPASFHHYSNLIDPVDISKEHLQVDVTRLLAKRRGIECEVIPQPVYRQVRNAWSDNKIRVLQFIFRITVRISNMVVTFFQKPRPIKLFASDPWYRLEPFIKNMDDVELVMTRRKEMREMGWKNIWRTRTRFHHWLDFVDADIRTMAKKNAQRIISAWSALGDAPPLSSSFVYKGISYWPIAKEMFDLLIRNHTEDAIVTIENTKELLRHYDINCVLLFSSTKGYNNVIANVAEKMNIPSVELQHALSTVEVSSPHTRLHSRYLAAYGAFTRRVYENAGIESWRIIECGSPRFDHYAFPLDTVAIEAMRKKLYLDNTYLNVLINVPQILSPTFELVNYSSYQVEHSLEEYGELQKKHPKMRLLLRPRPGPWRQSFYHREEISGLFNGEIRDVQHEDLHTLFALSDIVISGCSTLVLEALMMRKPIICLPKKLDHDFQELEDAGAILMARTREDLLRHAAYLENAENRELLIKRADVFLRNNFICDGTSSERISAMIREITKKHL